MNIAAIRPTAEESVHSEHRLKIHHRFPWGTTLAGTAFFVFGFLVARELVTNPRMGWDVVGDFLFNQAILEGVVVTIELTVLSQLIGTVLGFFLATAGASRNPVARAVNFSFIAVFRGTPLLVQLLIWYNLALFLPQITLVVPWTGWSQTWGTNEMITGFTAALLGLALNEAAYMSEIFRGGFAAVPRGQTEAALSIGMRPRAVTWRIVLPQSIRIISPAVGNQLILLLKTTSLVAVIGGGDLLSRAQQIYGQNLQIIPLLIVATIWYLAMIAVAQLGQYCLERRFSVGPKRVSVAKRLATGMSGRNVR
ncbi:amino acid ABC transporter permease [Rhodococcus globerulus]|uniref:amino acid ABC transporter permease n=1 Tax=Rhodococcus globerulus TaxID=33008 RepID=UPI0006924782|nr:amino acid ABC transporter permease [Rhodococcus globerulus]PVX59583.1 amino acid ABC transporter membrane protein (PAAT family) [Rhodococcus globerulus]